MGLSRLVRPVIRFRTSRRFRANGKQLKSGGGTIRLEEFEAQLFDAVYQYASLEEDERTPRVQVEYVKRIAFQKLRYRSPNSLRREVEREGRQAAAEMEVPAEMEDPAQMLRPNFHC